MVVKYNTHITMIGIVEMYVLGRNQAAPFFRSHEKKFQINYEREKNNSQFHTCLCDNALGKCVYHSPAHDYMCPHTA